MLIFLSMAKYKEAYNILMDYYDELSEESREEINKALDKLGL